MRQCKGRHQLRKASYRYPHHIRVFRFYLRHYFLTVVWNQEIIPFVGHGADNIAGRNPECRPVETQPEIYLRGIISCVNDRLAAQQSIIIGNKHIRFEAEITFIQDFPAAVDLFKHEVFLAE